MVRWWRDRWNHRLTKVAVLWLMVTSISWTSIQFQQLHEPSAANKLLQFEQRLKTHRIHQHHRNYIHERKTNFTTRSSLSDAETRLPSSILVLSSMGRSGSSFLGGVLTSLPGVFYFFEPLYSLGQWNMMTPTLAVSSLRKIFLCNMSGPILTAVRARGRLTVYHRYVKSCKTKHQCFEPHLLNSMCGKERVRLVKTVRTRVSWLHSLLEDPTLDLRVIHLVRDPRGALISGWKAGWPISAKATCEGLYEDLQYGAQLKLQYPRRYMAVRYEDICKDPFGAAGTILSFLGQRLQEATLRFLEITTSRNASGHYGVTRDTGRQQQKWRTNIQEEALLTVEKACGDAITTLGFNKFFSLAVTRNLSYPLYNASHINSLFSIPDSVTDAGSAEET